MKRHVCHVVLVAVVVLAVAAVAGRTTRTAAAALPPGNTVEQWNKIAEDMVVGSGAFQNEGLVYMADVSTAVYDATAALEHGKKPLEPSFRAWRHASPDAAVIEAAYQTLAHFFPAAAATLDSLHADALALIPDGPAKLSGEKIGWVAANQVIRSCTGDGLTTSIATTSSFPTLEPRLAAMVDVVGADAQISVMYAKYHYLFWRPVSAIDPTSVSADGFGPTPGFDDGNPATAERAGWRPLLTTPNHPEYPAAHGSLTSAMADVFASFLGTTQIALDIHGFDPSGPVGNLNAVRHFATATDLTAEIVNARVWAGVRYRFSAVAGVDLGRNVSDYDLKHAFNTSP